MEHGSNIEKEKKDNNIKLYACRFYLFMNGMEFANIEEYGVIEAESEDEAMSICLSNRWPKWWLYNKESNLRHVVEFWREHIQIVELNNTLIK